MFSVVVHFSYSRLYWWLSPLYRKLALCFVLLDGDCFSCSRDLRCSVFSLVNLTLQGFYFTIFSVSSLTGNFTSGFDGSLPLIVAGGDIPPFWIQFWSLWFSRNIYCSQDPLACAGECSVEALHFGSWWVTRLECKTWSILNYGGKFLTYPQLKPHWTKSL